MSDAEELSREKGRTKGDRERDEEGNGRPPTAAAEIFYELNCAGGFWPRESMCEDQTPRDGSGFCLLPPRRRRCRCRRRRYHRRFSLSRSCSINGESKAFLTVDRRADRNFSISDIFFLNARKVADTVSAPRSFQTTSGPEVIIIEGDKRVRRSRKLAQVESGKSS